MACEADFAFAVWRSGGSGGTRKPAVSRRADCNACWTSATPLDDGDCVFFMEDGGYDERRMGFIFALQYRDSRNQLIADLAVGWRKAAVSFFTYYFPFSEAHQKTIALSMVILAFFAIAVLSIQPKQIDLWAIAMFLTTSLWKEWKHRHYVVMRFLLERYYGKRSDYTKLRTIAAFEEERISHVLLKFYRGQKHSIVIMRDNNERVTLDENEILHAFFAEKQTDIPLSRLIYV